jgi:mono/diheme cytochrome c family protein
MNQIKYIFSAGLILLMIFMAIFLYKTFPESDMDKKQAATVDISQTEVVNQPFEFSDEEIEGKALFEKNCNTCHTINKTDNFLVGFENRGPWGDRRELYKWIRNPQDYTLHDATGYTKGLKEKYGVSMPPSPKLSGRDIDKIIGYLIKADGQ